MLEIGSILEKFNTMNSQLIQYWWYWFCTISVGCIGFINIQVILTVMQNEMRGNCGGAIAIPIYWLVFIGVIVLVILPITGFLHYAQQWFIAAKEFLVWNNSVVLIVLKIISILFLLIHLISTLLVLGLFVLMFKN